MFKSCYFPNIWIPIFELYKAFIEVSASYLGDHWWRSLLLTTFRQGRTCHIQVEWFCPTSQFGVNIEILWAVANFVAIYFFRIQLILLYVRRLVCFFFRFVFLGFFMLSSENPFVLMLFVPILFLLFCDLRQQVPKILWLVFWYWFTVHYMAHFLCIVRSESI